MRFKKEKVDMENLNEVISLSKRILRVGLIIAIIILVVLVSHLFKEWQIIKFLKSFLVVISPVFIGLLIAWLFDPLVTWLQKKMPRVLACILVYLVFFGGLILIVALMAPSFTYQLEEFFSSVPNMLKDFQKFINSFLKDISNLSGLDLSTIKTDIVVSIEKFGKSMTTDLPNIAINWIKSIISGGMFVVLGLMIGFYMLYDFDKVRGSLTEFLPRSWRENAKELGSRLNSSLRGYVQGVFVIMLLVFITQSIGLTLAGLEAPLVFALFCAITDIIPYFGPWIGGIPAVIVGFTISPFVGICTLISILVVQLLENNFYQPLIMGHAMSLHPVTIILGLLIFQHYFGIIGMIVATPVIACLKVIFTFIDEKIDVMEKIKGN